MLDVELRRGCGGCKAVDKTEKGSLRLWLTWQEGEGESEGWVLSIYTKQKWGSSFEEGFKTTGGWDRTRIQPL
jgi:hypothetical protein